MSKMDALRAMREAKYAETQRRSSAMPAKRAARPTVAPTAPRRVATTEEAEPPASEAEPAAGLCGHRNMGGRSCTRDAGHPQKSHRYS